MQSKWKLALIVTPALFAAALGSVAATAPASHAAQAGGPASSLNLSPATPQIVPAPGLGAAPATTYDELCDQGNQFQCINDWNDGSSVQKYAFNYTNDAYGLQAVDRCQSGSNLSTANCPISGIPAGYGIYQIRDQRKSNKCVGTPGGQVGGSLASETGCNSTSYPGTGGGLGTLVIIATGNGCYTNDDVLIDSYWTNNGGGWNSGVGEVQGDDTNGAYVTMDYYPDWCWGSYSF